MMNTTKVTVVKYGDRKNLVLRWTDPEWGRVRTKSAGTSRRREAERAAAALESEIAAGRHGTAASLTWQEFRSCYEEDCLSGLADRTFSIVQTVFKTVERLCNPRKLFDLTALRITSMQTALRQEGKSESTIACYSRHLLAALNWAHDHDMLVDVPKVKMPRRAKAQKLMKGRPITTEEFERMLMVTPNQGRG